MEAENQEAAEGKHDQGLPDMRDQKRNGQGGGEALPRASEEPALPTLGFRLPAPQTEKGRHVLVLR